MYENIEVVNKSYDHRLSSPQSNIGVAVSIRV